MIVNLIYSFVVGKNWLYAKTVTIELFHQPNMHVVIVFIHHSLWCEFASTFNVLTRFGLQRLMLQDYLTTSK